MSLELLPINDETFNYFLQDTRVGKMIRHPLYNTLAGNLDIELSDGFKKIFKDKAVQDRVKTYKDYHIEIIKQRQKFLKDALQDKDYEKVLFLIEPPYRLDWISENQELFDDNPKLYYELLKDAYVSTEFPLSNLDKDDIQNLFYYFDNPKLMMDKDEKKFFEKLDDSLTVYRGIRVSSDDVVDEENIGFSFTLDKDKAKWFATRLLMPNEDAYLITAEIDKKDILSVFLNRGEEEVLLDPEYLSDYTIDKLKTKKLSDRDIFTNQLQKNLWSA